MAINEILAAYSHLRRQLALARAAELKAHDFGHMQMSILYRLSLSNASMGELADHALADKASTTRAVSALQKAGLVKRSTPESDRRVTLIELTAKGRVRAGIAEAIIQSIGEQVDATLTRAERQDLARLLAKVATGLEGKRAEVVS